MFIRPGKKICWILTVFLMVYLIPSQARCATAESKYYAAERCAAELHNNSGQQKYRDRWLKCIGGFLAVYRFDPYGPWAAAGLYQAGSMYAELSRKSFLASDKQEALDLLHRVEANYTDSAYKVRAQNSIRDLTGDGRKTDAGDNQKPVTEIHRKVASAPDPSETARQWYEKAQQQDRLLQEKVELQKYRTHWLKSIDYYRKALQADSRGPLAAAALYGMAESYAGLYKWSRSTTDQIQSEKTFEELISTYPDSTYAAKARTGLPSSAYPQASDAISQLIQEGNTARTDAQDSSAQQPATVESLRFWSNPRYTRVVIDATLNTSYTCRELREDPSIGKPKRIYIDVQNSRLGNDLQKVIPINDNLLSDARAGQYAADTVRVVVDIKSAKTFKIFSLKNPFRIVLDVWGVEDAGSTATALSTPVEVKAAQGKLPASAIVKQLALGVRRIVIDPGHGGKDCGAPGFYKGVSEKQITLEIAKRLAAKVRNQLKCEVIMTRNDDTYLSLEERTAIANTQNADLFVSIHTNASPNHQAYGFETFILNLATDDEAILVAARENATSARNISDLDSILKDLMQNAKVNESTRLASYVQHGTLEHLKGKYDFIRSKGVKKAPFYVLMGADMPSILVETSFISNARECKRLTSDAYQELLCQGIIEGIKRYIEETSPMAFQEPKFFQEKG